MPASSRNCAKSPDPLLFFVRPLRAVPAAGPFANSSNVHRRIAQDAIPRPQQAPSICATGTVREHLRHFQPLEPILETWHRVDQVDESVARVISSSADLYAARPPKQIHIHERLPPRFRICATRPVHLSQTASPVTIRDRCPITFLQPLLLRRGRSDLSSTFTSACRAPTDAPEYGTKNTGDTVVAGDQPY